MTGNRRGAGLLLAAGLFLAALFVGSRESPAQAGWKGTIRDSAGVVILENPADGLWSGPHGWALEEELRFGGLEDQLPYQFGQVGSIAVDSKGQIYVSDSQAQEVRVFSQDGEFRKTIGRPGSGPGELGLGASVVLLAPGDTVLIPDIRNRRINRFGPDGENLGSAPFRPEDGRPLRYDLTSAGGMSVQIRPPGAPGRSDPDTMDAVVAIEPSGLLGDTLLRIPTGGLLQGPGITYFTPEPWWDVTDSLTVLFGMNHEYRIGFHDRDGSLRRVVSKPSDPRPISDRDIRAFFSYLDRAWLDAGVPPSRLSANHQRVSFAENLPVFSRFNTGYQGSLWVQPVQAPGELSDEEIELYNFLEDFGSRRWEVFDREGRYMGVVVMPGRFNPRTFYGNKIYGVDRDEFDVQYVVRLRIFEK
ncbi:MAG: 6-bladed beta-propeller [Gemmatimonadota bacterium]